MNQTQSLGAKKSRKGVLLLNLGTPEKPETAEVRAYLKEFLMDPYVIDIPKLIRWFLVNQIILPKRPALSAAAYRKVWTERGSPLLFHLKDLVQGVEQILSPQEFLVLGGMRYGNPSLQSVFEAFHKEGMSEVTVFPMYPQYSLAATESSVQACQQIARAVDPALKLNFIPAFYEAPDFIAAYVEVAQAALADFKFDHLLMSFHGLPERQIKKTDPTHKHCLKTPDCCAQINETNAHCYRAQCYATARKIAAGLGLTQDRYTVCFQSRLGRTPWIRPFTDELYQTLPQKGVKRLAVMCPAFVADCLETLEEVQIRGCADFLKHGGEDFRMVPSLNSSSGWIKAVVQQVRASFGTLN